MSAASQPTPRQASRSQDRPSPRPDAIGYRINEVRDMGGPGRTKIYDLAKAGKLRLVKVAGITLVHGDSLRTLLNEGCK